MRVADAGHNTMMDNPLGFVDAVMASCNPSDEANNLVFGHLPLYLESGLVLIVGHKVEFPISDEEWCQAVVSIDHGDGTFDLQLPNGSVRSHEAGHSLRVAVQDVVLHDELNTTRAGC